jgi:ubiquinone/menaquinone biosynthesis C-methylase UbiE
MNENFEFNLRKNFSSDVNHLLFFAHGFIFSSILFSSLELKIFDCLYNNSQKSEDLSKNLNLTNDKLEPLLIALLSMGLLSKSEDNRYTNTNISQLYLTKESPSSLCSLFMQMKRHTYDVFSYLSESIQSGEPHFGRMRFLEGEGPFQNCYEAFATHPKEYDLLLSALNATSTGVGALISEQAKLHECSHLIDLGGGGGQIACEIAEKNPNLKITIVDLPVPCNFAEKIIKNKNLSHQVTCVQADILHELPPTVKLADAILLGGVISDFPEEKRNKILTLCKSKLKQTGSLLISETLFNQDKTGPLLTAILALYMIATTGGGNFSPAELKKILIDLEFCDIQIFQNGERGARDLVIAKLPPNATQGAT